MTTARGDRSSGRRRAIDAATGRQRAVDGELNTIVGEAVRKTLSCCSMGL
jgi:hypothetical protein